MTGPSRWWGLACFAAALAGVVQAQPQERFVTTQGRSIIDPGGRPLLLRGINLGNWLVPEGYMFRFDSATAPRQIEAVINELIGPEEADRFWDAYRAAYMTHEDVQTIRALGFNAVRIPFTWRLFDDGPAGDVQRSTGMRMLDSIVAWCSDERLWAIFDMHCAPGGQTGDNIDDSWGYPFLFESEREQERTVRIWRAIAARFADEPAVIGYDLLNEPIAHYFDASLLNPRLEPLYKRIVSAIREVDTNHIVFLGGSQWNSNFDIFGPPFDAKAVYTFHKYWTPATKEVIEPYLRFREKYQVPIWMGESGENTDGWIDSFRVVLETHDIGWCFWPYKKMRSSRCVVTFDQPSSWEVVRQYANGPRSSYRSIRQHRPAADAVRTALSGFIENCVAERSRVNAGYVTALGLDQPPENN